MSKSLTTLCLLASVSMPIATGFTPTAAVANIRPSLQLHAREASRRDFLASGLLVATAGLAVMGSPAQAANEVDFGKVQDLLGNDAYSSSPQQYAPPTTTSKRPTFLTDPTDEFKENERKSAEFKREQLKAKREFQEVLDKLQTDPNDGEVLAKDLDQMRFLVKKNIGLPEGITKDDVVKQVRRRKAKKYWPTDVEIAYQDLLYEILKKQSPNTDRDTGDFV